MYVLFFLSLYSIGFVEMYFLGTMGMEEGTARAGEVMGRALGEVMAGEGVTFRASERVGCVGGSGGGDLGTVTAL